MLYYCNEGKVDLKVLKKKQDYFNRVYKKFCTLDEQGEYHERIHNNDY